MTEDKIIHIPAGELFRPSPSTPVRGGNARVVPLVPVGHDGSALPCIWKSHKTVQAELADGSTVPACECLLLVSKEPPVVMRAEVALAAWQHFGECVVEW